MSSRIHVYRRFRPGRLSQEDSARSIFVTELRFARQERRASSGFTLVELLVAIAVIVILATIGIPAVQELIKDNRTASQARALSALLMFARSEAIRRNADVAVEFFEGRVEVRLPDATIAREIQWDRVAVTEPGENPIRFTNRGYLFSFDDQVITMRHENCQGSGQWRQFDVDKTGQLQVTRLTC